MRFFLAALVALGCVSAWPQLPTESNGPVFRPDLPVAGVQQPWFGGLNSAQFSHLDFNGDNVQDLLVFDRTDHTPLAFIREGAQYRYHPEFQQRLPANLRNWVLTADYNGDGFRDLFTSQGNTIRVLENTTPISLEGLGFSPVYSPLQTVFNSLGFNLYCNLLDIPGLVDVDSDGDLDILVFNVAGTRVDWHRNTAAEDLGRVDTFVMELASQCWGHFVEVYFGGTDYTAWLEYDTCDVSGKTLHSGGALLPLQLNGDSLVDVIISDVDVRNLIAMTNGGDRIIANMVTKDTTFPSYSVPADLSTFPAPFQVDFDGDGILDLMVSPNEVLYAEDVRSVWFYRNLGTNTVPIYELQTKNALQNLTLDFGTGVTPTVVDLDADGARDLVLGLHLQYSGPGALRAPLVWLRNTASDSAPSFEVADTSFLGLPATSSLLTRYGWRPTFGDLNADGRPDLLLGRADGRLLYWQNTTSGTLPSFSLVDTNYLNLAAQFIDDPAPHLADLDQDGDLDLLIGTDEGKLVHYRNTAVAGQSAQFSLVTSQYAGIHLALTTNPEDPFHATPLVADIDNDNLPELLLGCGDGFLRWWDSLEATPSPQGTWIATDFGTRVAPAWFPVLRADSVINYTVVGTWRGGMQLYASARKTNASDTTLRRPVALVPSAYRVWPNPTTGGITIAMPPRATARMTNALGQEVRGFTESGFYTLTQLPMGAYSVLFNHQGGLITRRLVLVSP